MNLSGIYSGGIVPTTLSPEFPRDEGGGASAPFVNTLSSGFNGSAVATVNNVGSTLVGAAGTICGWIKPTDRLYFLGLINDGATYNVPFNNSNGIILRITGSGTRTVSASIYRAGVAAVTLTSGQGISASNWAFFCLTWNASDARLFVRQASTPGSLHKSTSGAAGSQASQVSWASADLCLGSYESTDLASAFTGNMDEVATWNRKLSDSEVADIYGPDGVPLDLNGLSSAGDLTGWWRMGENALTSTIPDEVGSSDLTATAGVSFDLDVPT